MQKSLVLLVLVSCSSKKQETPPAPGSASSAPAPSSTPSPPAESPKPPTQAPPASSPPAAGSPAIAAANAMADAVALACKQPAHDVKGSEGTSYFMKCPDCATLAGSVWGTDRYTDDSAVCGAAVHSGAIPPKGGAILVTWIPGLPTYIGSPRNGITSSSYGKWGRSFYVQAVDASGKPTTPPPPPLPEGKILFDCHMSMDLVGSETFRVLCPAGCTTGSLWGTKIYTGDSAVCVAAVHAGLLTADKGGDVLVTKGGEQASFDGSAQNGVTSGSYEHFGSSFTLAK